MASQAVTLQLPLSVYKILESRAERARRSVEVELREIVTTVAAEQQDLDADLAEAVAGLEFLDDEQLWRAARTVIPAEDRDSLESLSFKQRREGLTSDEEQTQERLLALSDRVMLIRAQAALHLKERGFDVSELQRSS